MEHIPERDPGPPERDGYWEEHVTIYAGVVYISGNKMYTTPVCRDGNSDENRDTAEKLAQIWVTIHRWGLPEDESVDIEVEEVGTETIAHGIDPDDYEDDDR